MAVHPRKNRYPACDITTAEKLLRYIEEHAVDGEAVVSSAALAEHANLTKRSVMREIVNLEESGALDRFATWLPDGRQGPNRYVPRRRCS